MVFLVISASYQEFFTKSYWINKGSRDYGDLCSNNFKNFIDTKLNPEAT